MLATTWWQVMLAGMLGPVVVELAKIAAWRSRRRIDSHWKKRWYWVSVLAFVVLGGIVALMYGVDAAGVPVIRAAHIGATAPLLAAAWASSVQPKRKSSAHFVPEVQDISDKSKFDDFLALLRW